MIAYKLCSKLCKINSAYTQKIQTFYPRLFEIISNDTITYNSEFKDAVYASLGQSNINFDTILLSIMKSQRTKFIKDLNKLMNWQLNYSMLLDKSNKDRNKNNERFYIDKYVTGSQAFSYVTNIQRKYILHTNSPQISLFVHKLDKNQEKQYKNPYDILNIEDTKQNINNSQPPNIYKKFESVLEIIVSNYERYFKD